MKIETECQQLLPLRFASCFWLWKNIEETEAMGEWERWIFSLEKRLLELRERERYRKKKGNYTVGCTVPWVTVQYPMQPTWEERLRMTAIHTSQLNKKRTTSRKRKKEKVKTRSRFKASEEFSPIIIFVISEMHVSFFWGVGEGGGRRQEGSPMSGHQPVVYSGLLLKTTQ